MPKRKAPLPAVNYVWINGEQSFGEIVVQMVEQLTLGDPATQDAVCRTDQINRRAEIVRRIDAAHSERVAYETRQTNSGASPQKHDRASENLEKTRICVEALEAEGVKPTRKRVWQKWSALNLGQPPTEKTIGKYIKRLRPRVVPPR
jgi:hypothetical protein